jgi:hypothetical protein
MLIQWMTLLRIRSNDPIKGWMVQWMTLQWDPIKGSSILVGPSIGRDPAVKKSGRHESDGAAHGDPR